jgi:hypothetical protein
MTHLSYVVAAYVIALGVPIVLGAEAMFRVRAVRRRLDAIDTRRNRGNP